MLRIMNLPVEGQLSGNVLWILREISGGVLTMPPDGSTTVSLIGQVRSIF